MMRFKAFSNRLTAVLLSCLLLAVSLAQLQGPAALAAVDNLIANPSAESLQAGNPQNWTANDWGDGSSTLSVTNNAHSGNNALTVNTSARTDGDAKWMPDPVAVTAGQSYTYQDFSEASVATTLVVAYNSASGTSYVLLGAVNPSAMWQANSATFTVPAGTVSVQVLHLLATAGSLTTDDFSLTANQVVTPPTNPTPPTGGNLFPNPSLETVDPSNPKLPQSWQTGGWGTNTAAYSYLTTGHTGTRSTKVQLNAYTSGAAYWHSSALPVSGSQLYDFKDYYKANVPSEIDASVILQDGSEQDIYLGTAFASPNSWTKYETQFSVPAGAASITLYHDIYSVGYLTTDDFNLSAFSYQGFNRPLVSITDDDGFANYYTNGLPVLKKYGLPSTAYIISSYLGSAPYMTSAQLKKLAAAAVEIGSHSVDHADLSTQTAAQQKVELAKSQTTLQKLLGLPISDYAAPYGVYNQQIVTDAQQYYQSYRGVEAGYNARNNFDPMNLQVQNIVATTTVAQVQAWLQQAAATNTWLVLVYHEVSTSPTDATYNTTPKDFDAQMQAVKNSGLTVENISAALKEITPQL